MTRHLVLTNYPAGMSVAVHVHAWDGRLMNSPLIMIESLPGVRHHPRSNRYTLSIASWTRSIIVAVIRGTDGDVWATAPINTKDGEDVVLDVGETTWAQLDSDTCLDDEIKWSDLPMMPVPTGRRMIQL